VHWPAPAPDLVIQNVSWTPDDPYAGEPAQLQVSYQNMGDAATGSFSVGYWRNDLAPPEPGDHPSQSINIHGLAPGMTDEVVFTDTALEGTSWLSWVRLDHLDEVLESDEDNNVGSDWIHWQILPAADDLSASYDAGNDLVHLTWDYDGPPVWFNLYRGDTPYFHPSPGDLIYTGPDMYYAHAPEGGGSYYVVTAVYTRSPPEREGDSDAEPPGGAPKKTGTGGATESPQRLHITQ